MQLDSPLMLLFHLLFSLLKLRFLQAAHFGWEDSMASCQIKWFKDISMLIWFAMNGQNHWVFHHHLLTFLQQIFPVMLWVSQTPCLYRLGDTEKMCNPREWWQLLQSMLFTCTDSSMEWGLSGNLAMGPEAAWEWQLGKQFPGQWSLCMSELIHRWELSKSPAWHTHAAFLCGTEGKKRGDTSKCLWASLKGQRKGFAEAWLPVWCPQSSLRMGSTLCLCVHVFIQLPLSDCLWCVAQSFPGHVVIRRWHR